MPAPAPTVTRRRILELIALFSGAVSARQILAAGPTTLQSNPFGLGVASGSPSSTGFVLWTRLDGSEITADKTFSVDWQVTDPGKAGAVVARGVAEASPALGHSVHVEVDGLAPDRWYDYAFTISGHKSMAGKARTLPAPSQAMPALTFAYASCQQWESGYYAAYRHMAAENLDFIIFLGDYIYESKLKPGGTYVRTHDLQTANTIDDYRDRYALYKSDPDLQSAHARCPWFVTWDDHEIQNNYAGSFREGKQQARVLAGYQAFYENMPLRASTMTEGLKGLLSNGTLRIYTRIDVGTLATVALLDGRQYRSVQLCEDDKDTPNKRTSPCEENRPGRTFLGSEQEAWLDTSIRTAAQKKVRWTLIAQQTRFTPGNYRSGEGKNMSNDGWDGYPEARVRIINSLVRWKPKNPIIIGGDIHMTWVARVHQDPYDIRSPVVASEFCATSISSLRGLQQDQTERWAKRNPHCLLANSVLRGYNVVTLTAANAVVRLRVLDDATKKDAKVSTLMTYTLNDGTLL